MKIHQFLIFTLILQHLCAQEQLNFDLSQDTEEQEYSEFQDWKNQFNRNFESSDEENYRFKMFEQNNRKIKAHNSQKDSTYKMGLNQFSDLSDQEFSAIYLIDLSGQILEDKINHENIEERKESSSDFILHKHHQKNQYENKHTETDFLQVSFPSSLDLSTQAGVGPIRDQSKCGSCWAFSACAAMEYAYWKRTGRSGDLAEQMLVDCVYKRDGCFGGYMWQAFEWVANNGGGIAWENEYPYQARYGVCRKTQSSGVWLRRDKPYVQAKNDDDLIKQGLYYYGVLSVVVDAGGWGSYSSGIFQSYNSAWPSDNHAVALVGYGTDNGVPYWKIKNSWSTQWGEKGYMRLDARRDSNNNTRGGIMLDFAYLPQIN